MAATRTALRKLLVRPSSALLSRLINTPPACLASSMAAPFRRSFTTDVQATPADDTRSQGRSVSRRNRDPTLFSGVFDPFFPTRSLSQVLNLLNQFLDDPLFDRNWDVKEDEDDLYLRIDMPGLSKEDVRVVVEENTLVIRGEGQKEEDSEGGRRYSGRIDLPPKGYRVDEIRAEMKHGVLKVVVPKVKDEERQGVVEIAVDG